VDKDALGDEDLRVQAAHGVEADEALVADVSHHHADLVDVRGQDDAGRALAVGGRLGGSLESDDVAHEIAPHLVAAGAEHLHRHLLRLVLVARHAGGVAHACEQFVVHAHLLSGDCPCQSEEYRAATPSRQVPIRGRTVI